MVDQLGYEWTKVSELPAVNWRSVVMHPRSDIELLLMDGETWVVRKGEMAVRLFHPKGVVAGWRFLEMDYDDFVQQITAQSDDFEVKFPLVDFLLSVVLQSEREGWIEPALNWLSKVHPSELKPYTEVLGEFEVDMKHWQSNRHKMKRILAQVKRV